MQVPHRGKNDRSGKNDRIYFHEIYVKNVIGVQLGVSEFTVKPASSRDLVARIQTQVEASRKVREMEQALATSPPVLRKVKT